MGAIAFWARTDVRRGLRSALLLLVGIGVAGGVSLAALAGARRTDTAVDRFVAYAKPSNGAVVASPSVYARIARLPQVAFATRAARFGLARLDATGRPIASDVLGAVSVADLRGGRGILVAGREPRANRPDEVIVNVSAAHNEHLGVGSRLSFVAFAPEQADALLRGTTARPSGPKIRVRVVGVVRFPADLSTAQAAPGVTFAGQDTAIFSPAFLQQYSHRVAVLGGVALSLRLHDQPSATRTFRTEVDRLSHGRAQVFFGSDDLTAAAQARHATSLEATALVLFGIIAAAVTMTLVAQAFARRVQNDADSFPTLRAMGMSRRQFVVSEAITVATVAGLGSLLAIGLAILFSPYMPIGIARQAEVHRGYAVDPLVLLAGAAVIIVSMSVWGSFVAWRAAGPDPRAGRTGRASRLAQWLARTGAPQSATIGATLAFESGRGVRKVSAGTTVFSAVVALAVVAGALTFGSNLTRLADQPKLQGWNWDVAVGNPHSDDIARTAVPALRRNPDVGAFSAVAGGESIDARIDGHGAALFGIQPVQGPNLVLYTAGRAPTGAGEIALGAKTLEDRHLAIGERVRVSTGGPTRSLLVSGRVVLTPSVVNDSVPLGQAAVVTPGALRALHAPAPVNVFLVRFRPHVDRAAASRRLQGDFPGTVLPAVRPPDVENLRRVNRLPVLLAGLFALIGILTVGNALISSVRRRRHDLAVLRSVGFVRGQVAATVAWQATLVVLVAIVVGIPVGAAVGRASWTLVTDRLGLPPSAVLPLGLLAAVAVVALCLANVVALVPGLLATRTSPARFLRSE
jgi:hypothetical protein